MDSLVRTSDSTGTHCQRTSWTTRQALEAHYWHTRWPAQHTHIVRAK